MERTINVNTNFNALEKVVEFVKSESPFEASIEHDHWEVRTDSNGQMQQCVLIKKSGMHGARAYLSPEGSLEVKYTIPNKMMNAYFGKSVKRRRNVLEVVAGNIKSAVLAGSQKKAFDEIMDALVKMSA